MYQFVTGLILTKHGKKLKSAVKSKYAPQKLSGNELRELKTWKSGGNPFHSLMELG